MKQRILSTVAAVLCALTLFSVGIAPVYAYAPSDTENIVAPQAEEVRWYYRTNHGVEEMRLWSITRAVWMTDWIPVPEGWGT